MKKILSKVIAVTMIATMISGVAANAEIENGKWLTESQIAQMEEDFSIKEEESGVIEFGLYSLSRPNKNNKVPTPTVNETETVNIKFYILKEGCNNPLETEPEGNPTGNYVAAGVGTIAKDFAKTIRTKENAIIDPIGGTKVEQYIITEPEMDLPEGLYIDWYVLKPEADGLHIDGCIRRKDDAVDVDKLELQNAYIYGDAYSMVENSDGDEVVSSITSMRPDGQITVEEACAMIGRILVQNGVYDDFNLPEYPTFNDIGSDQWSYKHIEYVANRGAFFNSLSVKPSNKITRGQFAEIMACALNLSDEAPDSVMEDFADYSTLIKSPYYTYAAKLVNIGIFKGDSAGNLSINNKITRAEAITAINRMVGRDSSEYKLVTADGEDYSKYYSFSDLNKNEWYYEDIIKAASAYDDDGYIDPERRNQRDNLDK